MDINYFYEKKLDYYLIINKKVRLSREKFDEAFQNAVINCFRNKHNVKEMKSYFYTVLYKNSLGMVYNKYEKTLSLSDIDFNVVITKMNIVNRYKVDLEKALKLINSYSPMYKLILTEMYINGLTSEEIAKKYNKSKDTCRSIRRQGIKKIQKDLKLEKK